ncbi:MAG TPA: hypothetical protein VGK74_09755 [Symbiobacteriaceae bacterium]|jgi:hypothetical protein
MARIWETTLNTLLAVLVLTSLALSSIIWFPPEQWKTARLAEPQVNSGPVAGGGTMPDILRPERIYLQTKGNKVALLSPGSPEYSQLWRSVRDVLSDIRPAMLSAQVTEGEAVPGEAVQGEAVQGDSITLVLPLAQELRDWADYWGWGSLGVLNPRSMVDRLTLFLGPKPALSLTGPTGREYRIGPLPEREQKRLQDIVARMDVGLFARYRPLKLPKDSPTRIQTGILVPEVTTMKSARIELRKPDQNMEEARYFPDLSVVRKIDERDAQSFTDGQRLLKFSKSGVLEFWSVPPPGFPPDLARARNATKDWVDTHGGWPHELVLTRFRQQTGKSTMVFEIRSNGPFPVESADGAAQVEVVSADRNDPVGDRVTRFRRFPDITAIVFMEAVPAVPLISPEQALQTAAQELPDVMQDLVRELHLAYLVESSGRELELGWSLEPVWVIQMGDLPVYVPADPRSGKKPRVALL